MTTKRTRRFPALVVIAAALGAAALGEAATTGYAGKVTGAGPVSFRLNGNSLTKFRASVSVTCTSTSGGQSETYLLAPDKSAKLDKHGRFTLTYKKDKRVGGPFPLYKINATVKGKVAKSSASGTLTVSYYKSKLALGRLVLIACNSGTAKWSAKRS